MKHRHDTLGSGVQSMVERTMDFLRCPHLNPQNLCICYLLGYKGFCRWIKLRILKCWDHPALSRCANVMIRVLIGEGQEVKVRKRRYGDIRFEVEEGNMS